MKQGSSCLTPGKAAEMSISQTTVGGPTLPPAARYQIPFWPTRVEFMAIFAEMKKIGAVLAKRDAWARIAGCMREEAGSVVGSVIV